MNRTEVVVKAAVAAALALAFLVGLVASLMMVVSLVRHSPVVGGFLFLWGCLFVIFLAAYMGRDPEDGEDERPTKEDVR